MQPWFLDLLRCLSVKFYLDCTDICFFGGRIVRLVRISVDGGVPLIIFIVLVILLLHFGTRDLPSGGRDALVQMPKVVNESPIGEFLGFVTFQWLILFHLSKVRYSYFNLLIKKIILFLTQYT